MPSLVTESNKVLSTLMINSSRTYTHCDNSQDFFFLSVNTVCSLWQTTPLHPELHPHASVCFLHVTGCQHFCEGQSGPLQCWTAGL